MTTVAVTGATGFLGQALVRALAERGANIVALARPTSKRAPLEELAVRWVEGDVRDPGSLTALTQDAEWLIHAAGMLGRAGVAEREYHALHVDGTRNVLEAAGHCSRILYISSPGVLGPIEGPPADETAAPAPSNAYERSKAEAEQLVESYGDHGLPVIIARPEFVYGPGDTHVLGLFRAVAQRRFFHIAGGRYHCHPTFVDDAVDGMMRCLYDGSPGEIYHLMGPQPVTFRELAESIAVALDVPAPWLSLPRSIAWLGAVALEAAGKVTGRPALLSRNGVAFFSEDRRFSWAKAERMLDYTPQYDLQSGIALAVRWYRNQGML
jgi:nucleoside-diphosphate-sugar epimerase